MLTPTLRREEGWLSFAARIATPIAAACAGDRGTGRAALLECSGRLPGNCKLAGTADQELVVRAELPERFETPERVAAIELGFAAAAAHFGLGAEPPLRDAGLPFLAAPDLANLCAEAGWSFEQRDGGTLIVDLGVPGTYLAAQIAPGLESVSLTLEVVALPEADGLRRWALVEFLLRANGAFRMVRAVLAGSPPQARLEVVLPLVPAAEELGAAIAALAVAARHCALAARFVAADEKIARLMLYRSGMSSLPA